MLMNQQLPVPLRYLQAFVATLAELAPDERHEDVDAAPLERALRKRLRGFDEVAAEAELARDRALLETWLKESAQLDHPAYWIVGFLSLPNLATQLIQPAVAPAPQPTVRFEAPDGWKVKVVSGRLDLKKGKLVGSIGAIDEVSFQVMQRQQEIWPAGLPLTRETLDVRFGACVGKKYLSTKPFKRVDYLLAVPGGFVTAMLSAMGADFDEAPFESKLATLQLSGTSQKS